MTGLTPERQEHIKELKVIAQQLEARGGVQAMKLCRDCGVVILELATGCDCDTSAGVLGAARKLLGGVA